MEAYLIKTYIFQTKLCFAHFYNEIPKYFSDQSVKLHVSGIVRVKSSPYISSNCYQSGSSVLPRRQLKLTLLENYQKHTAKVKVKAMFDFCFTTHC
jgi:23S rRNA C2498 (ribose-2'-O)-methylase RlmM